ncbi:ArfGap-domain-containing protein, partial [Piromyces finnis]
MDFKQVLNELKNINGNNSCIDCGAPDPQWASINYGTFLCSKCFDEHRLLDESSVRSITIDTWNEEQILRMKLGGNDRAERFFTNQPEYRKNMSIKEQYSSNFANTYANKLTKICQKYIENADNQMSPISTTSGISTSSEINIESNESNNNDNNNNTYRPSKERNEEFFARKGRENEQRDENLPPSKGGKYTGFGSKPLRTEKDLKNEGITQFQKRLSTGWDFLTSAVNSINENVIKPASNKVRDPQFTQNLEN